MPSKKKSTRQKKPSKQELLLERLRLVEQVNEVQAKLIAEQREWQEAAKSSMLRFLNRNAKDISGITAAYAEFKGFVGYSEVESRKI